MLQTTFPHSGFHGGGSAGGLITNGLIAEYRFDDGSGTQLTDYSANAYHGLLGNNFGAAYVPAWTAHGCKWTGTNNLIAVPQAMMNAMVSGMIVATANRGTLTGSGLSAMLGCDVGNFAFAWGDKDNRLQFGGGVIGQSQSAELVDPSTSDFQCAGFSVGTSPTPDLFFLNGRSPAMFQTGSGSTMTLTSPYLGYASGFQILGINNEMAHAVFYNRYLSFSEHNRNFNALARRLAPRGVTLGNYDTKANTTGQILFIGNSLTAGSGATNYSGQYPRQTMALLSGNYDWYNLGMGGWTDGGTNGVLANTPSVNALFNSARSKNVVIHWEITNDINGGATAAATYSNAWQTCQAYKNAGFQVIILDCMVRGPFNAGQNTIKTTDNGNLATDFTGSTADAQIWKPAAGVGYADRMIQISGTTNLTDFTNATYFNGDQIHLTNTGYGLVAAKVKTALNQLGVT